MERDDKAEQGPGRPCGTLLTSEASFTGSFFDDEIEQQLFKDVRIFVEYDDRLHTTSNICQRVFAKQYTVNVEKGQANNHRKLHAPNHAFQDQCQTLAYLSHAAFYTFLIHLV